MARRPIKKPAAACGAGRMSSNRAMRADLWPTMGACKLNLAIERTFPLDQVVDALAMMRANKHFGKIVVTM